MRPQDIDVSQVDDRPTHPMNILYGIVGVTLGLLVLLPVMGLIFVMKLGERR